jgi:dTDP-4-dehydrorhamnose reductase
VTASSIQDRLLITGGNGLLGSKLLELCLRRGSPRPISLSRQPCTNTFLGRFDFHQGDITDREQLFSLFARIQPRWVIHTAAMTDVDRCERDPTSAHRTNVLGAESVAHASREVGAHLLHLSTEYVFDGRAGPYREDDATNPISVYGRTKLESEQLVRDICPDAVVARTTILYGAAPNVRPNFVTWLLERLWAAQAVRIVDDQVGSPTLADNLAEMCLALVRADVSSVYHTAGADCIDRYRFARLAAAIFDLDPELIQPVSTGSLAQAAARPLKAGLCTQKLQREFPQLKVMTTREGLEALRQQLPHPLSHHRSRVRQLETESSPG